jgi:transcriptional regulator with XRE-family HTH domain
MTKLGTIILQRRTKLGMSLQKVAGEAGITKTHVWDIETGRSRNPTIKTLLGLATALQVSTIKLCVAALKDLGEGREK